MTRSIGIAIGIGLACVGIVRGALATSVYAVVPEQSLVNVTVGKAGPLSFVAGHTHEVVAPIRGTLTVDPAHPEAGVIAIEIDASELIVTGKDEPRDDVAKVQESMAGPRVLDVARHSTMSVFRRKAPRVFKTMAP